SARPRPRRKAPDHDVPNRNLFRAHINALLQSVCPCADGTALTTPRLRNAAGFVPARVLSEGVHQMTMRVVPPAALAAGTLAIFMLAAAPEAAAQPTFTVTNLVSNQQGVAQNFDPDLVNAWGIAHAPGAPLWVADNGTGKSTLYNIVTGEKQSLTVTIPGGAPTGIVFVPQDNGDNDDFQIVKNGVHGNSIFIFVTERGVIEGW